MMKHLLMAIVVLIAGVSTANSAQAASDPIVQVLINGETYSCNRGSNPSMNCAEAVKATQEKFEVCKRVGNSPSTCYRQSFGTASSFDRCSEYQKACDAACKSVGSSPNNCYDECYN